MLKATALFVAATLGGCPKKVEVVESPTVAPVTEKTLSDGVLVVEVDLDGDERVDIYNYYRPLDDDGRLLLRKEIDLNRDGSIDLWTHYAENGNIEKEEMDSDFDGVVDWVDHYQGGKRVMSEIDTQNSGRFDLFKYYEGGKIHRKERDTTGDGVVDLWEYFDQNGTVIKVGRDIDNDGQMDVREE